MECLVMKLIRRIDALWNKTIKNILGNGWKTEVCRDRASYLNYYFFVPILGSFLKVEQLYNWGIYPGFTLRSQQIAYNLFCTYSFAIFFYNDCFEVSLYLSRRIIVCMKVSSNLNCLNLIKEMFTTLLLTVPAYNISPLFCINLYKVNKIGLQFFFTDQATVEHELSVSVSH